MSNLARATRYFRAFARSFERQVAWTGLAYQMDYSGSFREACERVRAFYGPTNTTHPELRAAAAKRHHDRGTFGARVLHGDAWHLLCWVTNHGTNDPDECLEFLDDGFSLDRAVVEALSDGELVLVSYERALRLLDGPVRSMLEAMRL
jgi:hypothetical protein